MSCTTRVSPGQFVELLGRIVGWDGNAIVPDDVDAISYSAMILEEATGDENEVDSFQDVALVVADCIEITPLINPTKWKEDEGGYNFHFVPNGAIFSQRGELYLIRVTFELVDTDLPDLIAVYLLECV